MESAPGAGGSRGLGPRPPLPTPGEPAGLYPEPPPHAPSCIKKGWDTQPPLQWGAAREGLRRMEPPPIPSPHVAIPQPRIGPSFPPSPPGPREALAAFVGAAARRPAGASPHPSRRVE